ncbi:MAG: hypothetical protein ACLVJK_02600 [Alistipes putredinis]
MSFRRLDRNLSFEECLPEGDADRIDDLVPVWWEFHTSDQAGERPNDFSFSELKEYLF